MILNDDVNSIPVSKSGETGETVGRELDLFIPGAVTTRIHADRMTTEKSRGLDPLVMVLDGRGPRRRIRVSQVAFGIAHDE